MLDYTGISDEPFICSTCKNTFPKGSTFRRYGNNVYCKNDQNKPKQEKNHL